MTTIKAALGSFGAKEGMTMKIKTNVKASGVPAKDGID
jgi:hypothetical protein